jgi:hypothetical protein
MILGLLEGGALFVAVCSMVAWSSPRLLDWIDLASVLGQGFALSACCIVAFYYNDLYDLRVVRSLSGVASRLVQSFGVAFILLATFYTVFPDTRVGSGRTTPTMMRSAAARSSRASSSSSASSCRCAP